MVSMRWLAFVLVLFAALAGISYLAAGRTAPATLVIEQPTGPVGQQGILQFTAGTPRGAFTRLDATLEQNGKTVSIFDQNGVPEGATVKRVDADHVQVTRQIGKAALPDLQQGQATIRITAVRTSFLRLRDITTTATRDVKVMLEPPRVAVLSTKHYLNHGGSEFVVFRTTPADVDSGVRVGNIEYRGYPASGAGIATSDAGLKVAFFALLHDQPVDTPVVAFARDAAGNESHVSFVDDVFEKPFRKSRIPVDDRFLGRVVPEILSHSPQVKVDNPTDLLAGFLKVNGDLRQINADQILTLGRNSGGEMLWKGPFIQLGNSQVEASFADARTYVYDAKDVDRQTHLGFDLAVTANVPVLAANSGKVVNADWLGIYGNCVIIDHGLGVASLYGHLSSLDVKVGDPVSKGQVLGRSGMTGLAGGDHLHFTMLVGGHPVNPVEWWDAHWIQDRVERKLLEAGATKPAVAAAR
jgi:hypothetical protein